MSDEMAVPDNATGDEAPMQSDEAAVESATEAVEEPLGEQSESPMEQPVLSPTENEDPPTLDNPNLVIKKELDENLTEDLSHGVLVIKEEIEEAMTTDQDLFTEVEKRGIKRRASDAFSEEEGDLLGFPNIKQDDIILDYSQALGRLEEEVTAASATFTPLRTVKATCSAISRGSKRLKTDTDRSRPSSALSSRSEDDNPSASPAQRGRRATIEISSPLLRVPLERGWKRELVYRAALDIHAKRNADIYYYTPAGKKLRSTREIAENLYNTGLTLENFSFFKEPLGVDDPEKEIIRDAKVLRKLDSPVVSPAPQAADGKRTHKPKAPKGASPEPALKTPPLKIKVKSLGSRLSSTAAAAPTIKQEKQKKNSPSPAPTIVSSNTTTTTPASDNNNTSSWKKPRAPPAAPDQEPAPRARAGAPPPSAPSPVPPRAVTPLVLVRDGAAVVRRVVTPPPRQVTPPPAKPQPGLDLSSPDIQSPRSKQVVQPCSLTCGMGVPSLSCTVCLCMYHPKCAGFTHNVHRDRFLCKNCRKSSSPTNEPVAVSHKSVGGGSTVTPTPRRLLPTQNAATNPERRVTLRMKVSGGSDGERVWAVAGARPPPPATPSPSPAPTPAPAPAPPAPAAAARASLPQSLAVINGKRFIVVPRPAPLPQTQPQPAGAAHETKLRSRVANGSVPTTPTVPSPSPVGSGTSPRRRGRPRSEETDHFTAFYNKAKQGKNNVVVQIFQYLGMKDLAHCARVCRLWRQLAATPSLWRHVRMKNSQVSDWGGLCAALKRHGTKWLDLRKMLLPQNDTVFWEQFAQHIGTVDTLERLEMCRCPASAVEAACGAIRALEVLSALAIRDAALDPAPLAKAPRLTDLRLKSMAGLALSSDLTPLAKLTRLTHLSLTSIKELGWRACDVIGELSNLESLELGECTFRAEFAGVLARLGRLRRLRLERGTAHCAAPAILRALALLPALTSLELVNIDVKIGFDDALAECKNIQRLLIIPTYVSQSATTNKQVLSGVLRLKESLTHLMWGVTIELLRVTELFIDQCSAGGGARRDLGECIPVLKPVPGVRLPMDHHLVAGPPQVEILPLPTLQRLLSAQLPNTKLKLLRIPFHATWRQSLADFQ